MKHRIKFFFFYSLFFMLYFATARLLFLIYNFDLTKTVDFSEIVLSFFYGMRQDASVTGYFLVIPGLLIVFTPYIKPLFFRYFINIYTVVLLLITSIIIVFDTELYKNWGFRTDTTPLLYLSEPKYAAASTDIKTLIILLIIFLVLFLSSLFVFRKYIDSLLKKMKSTEYKTSLLFLVITGTLILPIRGSVGIAPMNTGTVYFSKKNVFINHAAINVIWNVGFALSEMNKFKKVVFFEDKKADKYFNSLYPDKKSIHKNHFLLKNKKPNIVIIILESFTAKISSAFGGRNGISPNLNKLAHEGIMFKNFYASGDRTVKGIVAVLSGYPALPKSAIMNYSGKIEKLPTLTRNLKDKGYKTEWICGFDINFANIKSYLIHNNFDKIVTIDDFPDSERNSKWGIHDHIVFNKLFEECKNEKNSYFKVFMTLSSHEPFEVPMKTVIKGNDEESLFLNSVYYTDKSLGKYIENMKTLKNWDNTLIILVADHGSKFPGYTKMYLPEKFHIPMIWTGGAIKKDTVTTKYAGQTDIAATLLNQLNISADEYNFSKDIFSKESKSFAFYDFNNGFGFLTDTTIQVFDNNQKKYIKEEDTNSENIFGKAYLQHLMNDFISK